MDEKRMICGVEDDAESSRHATLWYSDKRIFVGLDSNLEMVDGVVDDELAMRIAVRLRDEGTVACQHRGNECHEIVLTG